MGASYIVKTFLDSSVAVCSEAVSQLQHDNSEKHRNAIIALLIVTAVLQSCKTIVFHIVKRKKKASMSSRDKCNLYNDIIAEIMLLALVIIKIAADNGVGTHISSNILAAIKVFQIALDSKMKKNSEKEDVAVLPLQEEPVKNE